MLHDAVFYSGKPEPDICGLTAFSYVYYGWAIRPEDYLVGDTDDNMLNPQLGVNVSQNMASTLLRTLTGTLVNPNDHNEAFHEDLPAFPHESRGMVTIPRLREGVERFFITDINNPAATAMSQSDIVVMYDHVGVPQSKGGYSTYNHVPGGCNVLYMDGHVEFVKYPTKYPASRVWAWVAMYVDKLSP